MFGKPTLNLECNKAYDDIEVVKDNSKHILEKYKKLTQEFNKLTQELKKLNDRVDLIEKNEEKTASKFRQLLL